MSKQKKTKKPPVLGRLLAYAGGHKWLSVLGCGLSGVSAAVGIFPFVFVWYAARGILTPGGGVSPGLARYGWYALAAALLSAAIYFAGLMCTHLAAFRVATNMRKAAVAHLVDLPLGYFNANLTGRLRKQIDDNAALTETLLAHTIPDAVGGIVTNAASRRQNASGCVPDKDERENTDRRRNAGQPAAQDGQPLMPSGICQQPAQHRRLLFFSLFAHIPCSFLKIYGFVGGCAASVRDD